MAGVETTELDKVVVEAFRTALEIDDACGETSMLKGLSFENTPVSELDG
jgi:hypothetical protein